VKGLEVSPGSLCQDQLIKRQVRDCPAEPFILFLKLLEATGLINAHATILTPPPIVSLFGHPNGSHRLTGRNPLA